MQLTRINKLNKMSLGQIKENRMKKLLITTGLLLLSSIGYTQDLSGDWSGKLIISEQRSIPFAFHLTFKDGNYQTIVDIPKKGISGMIAKDTELHNDTLKIDLTNVGMKYEGIINYDTPKLNHPNNFLGNFCVIFVKY